MPFFRKLSESTKEFKKTQSIASAGLLLAAMVVCRAYLSINIAGGVKIGVIFVPIIISAYLLGPAVAGVLCALGDILGYVLNPSGGAYIYEITISMLLSGIIYGAVLYKSKFSPLRTVLARVAVGAAIDLPLTTLWLNKYFGLPYFPTMGARAIVVAGEAVVVGIFALTLFKNSRFAKGGEIFNS